MSTPMHQKPPRPSGKAILQKFLQRTSPQCFLEFYYYYNSSDKSVLSVEYAVGTTLTIVLQQSFLSLNQWQRLLVAVGQPHSKFVCKFI